MKSTFITNKPSIQNLLHDKCPKLLIYFIFTLIIWHRHGAVTYLSDDIYTLANVGNYSLYEYFLYLLYFNGRIATDLFANIWYRFDLVYWKIFDTFVYLIIAILFSRIFTKNKWYHSLVSSGLVLLFPFNYMTSAGYIATSANYLYPILCLLVILLYIKYISEGRKTPKLIYPFVLLAILYATNHDQSAIVILVGLVFYLIYCVVTKQEKRIIFNILGVFIVSVVTYFVYFMLPGHIARMTGGTLGELRWLPEFADWTFWDKVYHGYSTTVANLFYNDVFIFTSFAIILLIASLRQKDPLKMFVGFVPFAGILISHYLGSTQFIAYPERCYGMTELMELRWFILPFILAAVMLICIFAAICFNVKKLENKLLLILLLILGAGTRLMMGFTPTIYASSYRTFTFFLFALIACNLLLLNDLEDDAEHKYLWYMGIGIICSLLTL